MKKKKLKEVFEWKDLKVGDFFENKNQRMFCFQVDGAGNPSCCGRMKQWDSTYSKMWVLKHGSEYTRMKPSKSFVKTCKRLLEENFTKYHLDNLSYIEALAVLNSYDSNK